MLGIDEVDRSRKAAGQHIPGELSANRIAVSACSDHRDRAWTKRVLQVPNCHLRPPSAPHGGWLELTGPGGRKIYPKIEHDEHPAAGTPHRNFVNALLGREELVSPVRYGVLLSALMDAIYEAGEKRGVVQVRDMSQ